MERATALAALVRGIEALDVNAVAAVLAQDPDLALAEIGAEGGRTRTPLHQVVPGDGEPLEQEHMEIARLLIDAGADPNALGWVPNHGLAPALTQAAWGGHTAMVRLLIQHGADPAGRSGPGTSRERPIDTAARHGHGEAVEALIGAGAGFTTENVLQAGLVERLRRLLRDYPLVARRRLKDGTPPLHLALTSPHALAAAELLLDSGAPLRGRDPQGRTPLHVAIEQRQEEAVRRLIRRGASLDLFAAAGLGNAERVEQLLRRDPRRAHAAHRDGTTALFYAAWSGDVRSARLLLSAGAAVSPKAKRFWACLTPLHLALQQRHQAVTMLLLEHGAEVDAFGAEAGAYWPTPLHVAARWGTMEEAVLLLDHGADPNGGAPIPDSMDAGVLSWAVAAGKLELVELLLRRGLEPGQPRHREALPLAAERGNAALVRLLVENGADAGAPDAHGQTPLERARKAGKTEVVALLEAWTRR
jgi:ankyrin repeat protein